MNPKNRSFLSFINSVAVFSLLITTGFSLESDPLEPELNKTKKICAFEIYEPISTQNTNSISGYMSYCNNPSSIQELPLQQMACFWCKNVINTESEFLETLASKELKPTEFRCPWGLFDEVSWQEEFANDGLKHLSTLPLQVLNQFSNEEIFKENPEQPDSQSRQLLVIYLYENITDEEVKNIIHLPFEDLNLSHGKNITDLSLKYISTLPLTSLWLNDCKNITNEGLKHLQDLSYLESLNLQNCENITDEGLEALTNLPIKELNLSNNKNISDKALMYLKELHSLECLELENCENITDKGLEYLKELNIKELNLSYNKNISNAGLEHLKNIPLEELDLSHCQRISNKGLKHLKDMPLLKSLDLEHCQKITNSGLKHLKDLPLEDLSIICCKNITHKGMNAFEELSSSEVSISWDGISCD